MALVLREQVSQTTRTDRQKPKELPLSPGMGGEKSEDIITSDTGLRTRKRITMFSFLYARH